jgi:hypothetical protein
MRIFSPTKLPRPAELAIATPSTSQSSKNQMIGVTMPRSIVNGCSNF